MSDKESAETFARIAENKGYQTISFDLPEHRGRKDENYRCDIWNGISDLHQISAYTFANWKSVSLFACSLGAYFKNVADSIFFEYDKFGRRLKSCRFSFPSSMNNTGFILAALGGSRFDKAL